MIQAAAAEHKAPHPRMKDRGWLVAYRAVGSGSYLGTQAAPSGLRERIEQGLTVREVTPWRGVADAGLASELAQRQRFEPVLAERPLGLCEQRRAEIAVVVGTIGHGPEDSTKCCP